MMKSVSVFYRKGRESLKGNWLMSAAATALFFILLIFIYVVLIFLFGVPIGSSLAGTNSPSTRKIVETILFFVAWFFAFSPLLWSYMTMFLGLARGEKLRIGQLFSGYSNTWRITLAFILTSLCQWICLALLILIPVSMNLSLFLQIPFCIVAIAVCFYLRIIFSQFMYVIYDDDEEYIGAVDAIKQSIDLMNGHKWQFLWLDITLMVFMYLICIVTLGIGLFFVLPFMATVYAHFYDSLAQQDVQEA